ncbi:hypothetical protein CC85DRAFT_293166 [Cutaneotrichosporon oleaginosum]|uniref:Zn(2)-C6 fungal-type domain-containing protein n=1 Tax=Cutaneotrichosporon oleaginosum TaxID=879819 RepID=A0A0J0XHM8_9TREE|nr:uncharacterized protein CC85DRAFT_293166 [Cutaneotrichosporon oleaginosum]KLT40512.1 hypothetical protein CC85DRAFT_293166 [Cutaneotrichosporon oleaginosum]
MDASKPRQACVGCRRIKVACDNPQTGDACKRCVRLALACVYTKSQRGRRNDRLNARRSASPGRSSPATAATPSTRSWALDAARPRTSNLDMAELLDPEIPSASAPASAPGPVRARAPSVDAETRRMFEDPVDVGYVTLAEAHSLVKFFHDKLNPLIAILDPELHTLTFLRTSSILFTTLLVTASKYVLPERHSVLLAHAESLINRATNAGDCSTALIQSLLILVYYKGPTDRSAWLKIGIAIRLAFQLRWHETPPTLHLPADEAAARRILDPERTWFCLVCFDRQYADIFGLPPAIRATDYGDVRHPLCELTQEVRGVGTRARAPRHPRRHPSRV